MISNVREWTPMALPRRAWRVISNQRTKLSPAQNRSVPGNDESFMRSFEKMLEGQAKLMFGEQEW